MKTTLKELLQLTLKPNISDLHINAGMPPQIRIDGYLKSANNEVLTCEDAERLCLEILTEDQKKKLKTEREIDLSFSFENTARFRANIFYQQGSISGAFRHIPITIPHIEELQLPSIVQKLTTKPRGLILVTGPTGSGKSTTLAAMINEINKTRRDRIITIEDPIEYIFQQEKCTISQREIGKDSRSFAHALKYILRQDPDVVMIGEMRDLETIRSAITVAETGHLVLATLHTNNAVQTVDRIIDVFPPHQQPQIRTQLSFILEAVLSQQLLPQIGGGRVAAVEVMLATPAIRNLIREGKTHQIYSQMLVGQEQTSMQSMNQALADLVNKGVVEKQDAIKRCYGVEEFEALIT